jgi:hypothetical protein
MRAFLPIILIMLLGTVAASAATIDTVRFDSNSLHIDGSARCVFYDKISNINDPDRPAVPALTRIYHAEYSGRSAKPSVHVLRADTLSLEFEPVINAPDQMTSTEGTFHPNAPSLSPSDSCFPAKAGQTYVEKVGGEIVWTVTLFPVQYLSENRIVFNRLIEITFDDPSVDEGTWDTPSRAFYGPAFAADEFDSSGCPLGHNYVIVTSPDLADAFGEFADLKRQTGYDAVIALTDSIFAHYSGIDHADALREYLAECYQSGAQYVLLGGDEDRVPVRYVYYYETDSVPSLEDLIICDTYFADYDGDWDADGDGIYGEPLSDAPDIGPEVALGRLPFSEPSQVIGYTDLLEEYLFNPGNGDRSYLSRSLFYTSDQMRDYFEGGQQYAVAEAFPASIATECELLAETPDGEAVSPDGPTNDAVVASVTDGYGMINILSHGRADGFTTKSSLYNQFPRSMILARDDAGSNLSIDIFESGHNPALYYSIACSQAAFDLESAYSMTGYSVVERLLSLGGSGAVGLVAFTRWGWVGSSYKLMQSFYQHLFSDAEGRPVEAINRSHLDYPYYTDQIYGQSFFGDPSLRIYTASPSIVRLDAPENYTPGASVTCRVTIDGQPLAGYPVTVAGGESQYETIISDAEGIVPITFPANDTNTATVTAVVDGAVAGRAVLQPSVTADAEDNDLTPHQFALRQNYPNPFNPSTTISFTLTRRQQVTLEIYDILGRVVTRLVDGIQESGEHQIEWNGTDRDGHDVASGMYLYRIIGEEGTSCRKMTLVK